MPSRLFVISGPSGAGKGTLVARLAQELPFLWVSISATTRKPRKGEVSGESYVFMTKEEFEREISNNGFLEWALYNDNYYGTPLAPIKHHLVSGCSVVLEIEVQGALQVKQLFPDACLIFIEPPSMEELYRRLKTRATDTDEVIERRLKVAEEEMKQRINYDISFVNDSLDETTKKLVAFIQEKCNP